MAWSAYFTLLGKLLAAAGAILTVVGMLISNTPLQVIGAIVGVLPVFLSQNNARAGGDDHITSPNQAANDGDEESMIGLSTRTPATAVQSMVDHRPTRTSENSLSSSRRYSPATATRPRRSVSPIAAASHPVSAGLSASPTTAQSDHQLQDSPSSSTSWFLQDETLHDTVTLVEGPEVTVSDTVLVDQHKATNHPVLRQRMGGGGSGSGGSGGGGSGGWGSNNVYSGFVQRLSNYYQKQGVATRYISYSHQAVPGIGYIAIVTLSNFNPPGQYTGTGGSIQGAKEAAARKALQALGAIEQD